MNKGFYIASLAILAASLKNKVTNKNRLGSLSIENLNDLGSVAKRANQWMGDPLRDILDISINIRTDKKYFNASDVEKAIQTIQRLNRLKKITIVIQKNFPIRILDGLITSAPHNNYWDKPIRLMKELSITVYTAQDMMDNFFNTPNNLSSINLSLNSNKIPESLFLLDKLKELSFSFLEGKTSLFFPENYNLKSLESLKLTTYNEKSFRTILTGNQFIAPAYISNSRKLKEIYFSSIAPPQEIKKLNNLENTNLIGVFIEPYFLEIKSKNLHISGDLNKKISIKTNNKTEFLSIHIRTSEGIIDLSFLSKIKKIKEINVSVDWIDSDQAQERKVILPRSIQNLSELNKLTISSSSYYSSTKPEVIFPSNSLSNLQLKHLSIKSMKLSFPSKTNLPSLQKIELHNCIIDTIDMSGLTSLKNIEIEGQWNNRNPRLIQITNGSFSGLSNLRRLKIKNVYFNQIPNISGLTNLTNVIIEGRFRKVNIPIIEKEITSLTKLKRLSLEIKPPVGTNTLHVLPDFVTMLPNLEYLNLKSSEISNIEGIDSLTKLKNIKASKSALKKITKRPNNYIITKMIEKGLSKEDAIKIMANSTSTPTSQLRRF